MDGIDFGHFLVRLAEELEGVPSIECIALEGRGGVVDEVHGRGGYESSSGGGSLGDKRGCRCGVSVAAGGDLCATFFELFELFVYKQGFVNIPSVGADVEGYFFRAGLLYAGQEFFEVFVGYGVLCLRCGEVLGPPDGSVDVDDTVFLFWGFGVHGLESGFMGVVDCCGRTGAGDIICQRTAM